MPIEATVATYGSMVSEPDFDRLARETPWPREEWEKAWNALSRPDAWPTVVGLVAMGFSNGRGKGPVAAAAAMSSTLAEPLRPREEWRP